MAFDDLTTQNNESGLNEIGPISWWSWRPGIQPRNALLIGVPCMLLALLLLLLGLSTLIAGIEDSRLPPLQVSGTVRHHSAGTQLSSPQLTIALHESTSISSSVTLAVSNSTFQQVALKAPVIVSYSQHLHFAYALEYEGKHYSLPGTSVAGNPIGSVALLLLGLLLLPYPALLVHWGWQDLLIERYRREKLNTMEAYVVDKRATTRTNKTRPGLTGRGTRSWYGIALLPVNQDRKQRIYTFSVSKETYRQVQINTSVNIAYSLHLHYVYSL